VRGTYGLTGHFLVTGKVQDGRVKTLIAIALLFMMGATAQAKLAPVDPQPVAFSPDDSAISTEAPGAMLEQNYFRAPQPATAASRVFPCRLQLRLFDKTQLAQSCN
jgi:hypothetical protein